MSLEDPKDWWDSRDFTLHQNLEFDPFDQVWGEDVPADTDLGEDVPADTEPSTKAVPAEVEPPQPNKDVEALERDALATLNKIRRVLSERDSTLGPLVKTYGLATELEFRKSDVTNQPHAFRYECKFACRDPYSDDIWKARRLVPEPLFVVEFSFVLKKGDSDFLVICEKHQQNVLADATTEPPPFKSAVPTAGSRTPVLSRAHAYYGMHQRVDSVGNSLLRAQPTQGCLMAAQLWLAAVIDAGVRNVEFARSAFVVNHHYGQTVNRSALDNMLFTTPKPLVQKLLRDKVMTPEFKTSILGAINETLSTARIAARFPEAEYSSLVNASLSDAKIDEMLDSVLQDSKGIPAARIVSKLLQTLRIQMIDRVYVWDKGYVWGKRDLETGAGRQIDVDFETETLFETVAPNDEEQNAQRPNPEYDLDYFDAWEPSAYVGARMENNEVLAPLTYDLNQEDILTPAKQQATDYAKVASAIWKSNLFLALSKEKKRVIAQSEDWPSLEDTVEALVLELPLWGFQELESQELDYGRIRRPLLSDTNSPHDADGVSWRVEMAACNMRTESNLKLLGKKDELKRRMIVLEDLTKPLSYKALKKLAEQREGWSVHAGGFLEVCKRYLIEIGRLRRVREENQKRYDYVNLDDNGRPKRLSKFYRTGDFDAKRFVSEVRNNVAGNLANVRAALLFFAKELTEIEQFRLLTIRYLENTDYTEISRWLTHVEPKDRTSRDRDWEWSRSIYESYVADLYRTTEEETPLKSLYDRMLEHAEDMAKYANPKWETRLAKLKSPETQEQFRVFHEKVVALVNGERFDEFRDRWYDIEPGKPAQYVLKHGLSPQEKAKAVRAMETYSKNPTPGNLSVVLTYYDVSVKSTKESRTLKKNLTDAQRKAHDEAKKTYETGITQASLDDLKKSATFYLTGTAEGWVDSFELSFSYQLYVTLLNYQKILKKENEECERQLRSIDELSKTVDDFGAFVDTCEALASFALDSPSASQEMIAMGYFGGRVGPNIDLALDVYKKKCSPSNILDGFSDSKQIDWNLMRQRLPDHFFELFGRVPTVIGNDVKDTPDKRLLEFLEDLQTELKGFWVVFAELCGPGGYQMGKADVETVMKHLEEFDDRYAVCRKNYAVQTSSLVNSQVTGAKASFSPFLVKDEASIDPFLMIHWTCRAVANPTAIAEAPDVWPRDTDYSTKRHWKIPDRKQPIQAVRANVTLMLERYVFGRPTVGSEPLSRAPSFQPDRLSKELPPFARGKRVWNSIRCASMTLECASLLLSELFSASSCLSRPLVQISRPRVAPFPDDSSDAKGGTMKRLINAPREGYLGMGARANEITKKKYAYPVHYRDLCAAETQTSRGFEEIEKRDNLKSFLAKRMYASYLRYNAELAKGHKHAHLTVMIEKDPQPLLKTTLRQMGEKNLPNDDPGRRFETVWKDHQSSYRALLTASVGFVRDEGTMVDDGKKRGGGGPTPLELMRPWKLSTSNVVLAEDTYNALKKVKFPLRWTKDKNSPSLMLGVYRTNNDVEPGYFQCEIYVLLGGVRSEGVRVLSNEFAQFWNDSAFWEKNYKQHLDLSNKNSLNFEQIQRYLLMEIKEGGNAGKPKEASKEAKWDVYDVSPCHRLQVALERMHAEWLTDRMFRRAESKGDPALLYATLPTRLELRGLMPNVAPYGTVPLIWVKEKGEVTECKTNVSAKREKTAVSESTTAYRYTTHWNGERVMSEPSHCRLDALQEAWSLFGVRSASESGLLGKSTTWTVQANEKRRTLESKISFLVRAAASNKFWINLASITETETDRGKNTVRKFFAIDTRGVTRYGVLTWVWPHDYASERREAKEMTTKWQWKGNLKSKVPDTGIDERLSEYRLAAPSGDPPLLTYRIPLIAGHEYPNTGFVRAVCKDQPEAGYRYAVEEPTLAPSRSATMRIAVNRTRERPETRQEPSQPAPTKRARLHQPAVAPDAQGGPEPTQRETAKKRRRKSSVGEDKARRTKKTRAGAKEPYDLALFTNNTPKGHYLNRKKYAINIT